MGGMSFGGVALAAALLAGSARAEAPGTQLKTELKPSAKSASPGDEVQFLITLSNSGDRALDGVTIHVDLSAGLEHEVSRELEQRSGRIEAGGRLVLEPLRVKAVAAGRQTCSLVVRDAGGRAISETKGEVRVAVQRERR